MHSVFGAAWVWGFVGGAGYAGTRLATALWGGAEIAPQARKLALAQFVLAMILAPFAAHAFTPMALAYFPRATIPPTGLMIGLSFNAVWPLLIERGFLRQLLADLARGLADRLTPGASR